MAFRSRIAMLNVLAFALVTSACDRTPGDPLDGSGVAALTGEGAIRRPAPTLPGLLYSAIGSVHAEQGADAARDLVRGVAEVQQQLDAAPLGARPALRRALREEQLRVVLLVHGDDVVARTLAAVAEEADRLEVMRETLARSGIAAPGTPAMAREVSSLLAEARSAATLVEALDVASRAAEQTERMRHELTGAARLPSLAMLFDEASSRLAGRSSLRRLMSESHALRAAAEEAVRSGARDRAQTAAEAARAAQIEVVLAGLGPDVVADLIGWAQYRVRDQQQLLGAVAQVRDVSRLERMNASARDLLNRAETRLREGDGAAALDLAAHAVDLLNSLENTLTAH